ncbi:hypothetical protein Z045_23370 [Rhodococcus pyridinivorans KG-16]|uniref:Alcohol dehydrogenase-like N-terminal domain-containing protein n=1 Tax=Rhodococcus pyridinivorans KG-16 TaxID=1441730 RepID=A0A0V9UE74_9NOCA|nr:alcohol dehydrogenase catalytic domain-containing protein [Rhodococcus pyridinivorans]KSZ56376.1 hypothetical protein Z045_23370 [Rhodococcus pyridinivorans KG-16]
MKGLLFREHGVVVRADLDTPIPGGGEVLVQVKAAGICGSHLHGVADGMYPHPAVLRHEFAGVTEDGTRVAITPVPRDRLVPIPEGASFTAGAMAEVVANGAHALARSGGAQRKTVGSSAPDRLGGPPCCAPANREPAPSGSPT